MRRFLRAVAFAALAAFTARLAPPEALAAGSSGPKEAVAQRLAKGEVAITGELLELAVAAKSRDFVAKAIAGQGLAKADDQRLREGLKKAFRADSAEWAGNYFTLKSERLERLARARHELGNAGVAETDKKLALAKKDFSGDLDKTFDGMGRRGRGGYDPEGSYGDLTGWPGGGRDERSEDEKGSWGSKPPQNGGNGGRVTFDDVIGIDEAKGELMEVVDMMKSPERYRRVGADIPTGILMSGPPGSGKTFTARALANEAGVNFLSMEGTAFIDKYVGESAKKVREFFAEARAKAPCIVFIDEIEALAGKRVEADQGAERETNGAVTQLLVEMDGLTENPDGTKPLVIVVGATNRTDMLDPAVMRPGRFDRKVIFNLPDVNGRKKLLDAYVKKKKVPGGKDLDLQQIASRTTGMSPADIKNLVNEAALLSARDNKVDPDVKTVDHRHFVRAIDRVVMGKERRIVLTEEEKKETAIHELGHAIVGQLVPNGDPISKITIIPRDIGALGVTMSEPSEDRKNWTKAQLEARIAMAMGGRVAEKMFVGDLTTGASSDLENAENIARQMVVAYGMSNLGAIAYTQTGQGNYLNGSRQMKPISEATQQKVDAEVARILAEAETKATEVLTQHKDTLLKIVPVLVQKETLEGAEFRELIKKFEGGDGDGGGQNVAQAPQPETKKPESGNPFRRFLPTWSQFTQSVVGAQP